MTLIIDFLIVLILAFFFFSGLRRGLIRQVLEIAGIIAAFVGAFYLAHHVANYLEGSLELGYRLSLVISAILLFIGILLFFHLIGLALKKMASITLLGPMDRLGGGVFGLLKGALIASLLLVIIMNIPLPARFKAELSRDRMVKVIYPLLPNVFDLFLSRTPDRLSFEKVTRVAGYGKDEALERAKEEAEEVQEGIKSRKKKAEEAIRELED